MIIIISLVVWLLCGLFAVYKMIKDDPKGSKWEIEHDVWSFIKICMILILGGLLSLIVIWFINIEDNKSLNKFLIKIVDKIGDTQDE